MVEGQRRDPSGHDDETGAAGRAGPDAGSVSTGATGDPGYQLLFEIGTDGMLLADASEKIVDANPAACRLVRRARQELVGTLLWGVFDPSYPIFEAAREADRGEIFRAGAPLLRGDGTSLPAEIRISRQAGGGLGVVFRDVTGRRPADEKPRESEERFDALVENALDMTTVCNPDNTIRYISSSAKRILGYDPEELVGEFVPGLIHPDDLELSARESAAILANPEHKPAPIRYRHKAGSWVHLESVINNLMEDPNVRGIVINSRDVTERIRLEEALREREERFRALVENGLDLIVLIDLDNTISYMSPSVKRILGYDLAELVGVFVPDLLHPDDKELAARESAKMLVSPVYQAAPIRYRHKDGSYRYLQGVFNNKIDDPNVGGIVANARDVTERVRLEGALRESEERFRAMVQNSLDFIALCNPDNTIRYTSPSVKTILGYDPEELTGAFVPDFIHPEDLDTAAFWAERINTDPAVRASPLRYRRKDGSYAYLEGVFSNRATDPSVRGVVCNMRDVTETVERQEEIRCLNEELEQRVEERTAELRRSLGVILALYEAGQVLTSTMDFDERGERLLEIMRRTPGLAAAVISLRGKDGEFGAWRGIGPAEVWVPARESPEGEKARRAVFDGGQPQAYRLEDPGFPPVGLCLPMRTGGGLVGVLEAFGSETLAREETLEALKSLADQAGGALENARLYTDLAERERRLEDLVGELLTAQEEERRNVAYDLHDGLTQLAVATHNLLQAFADDHPPGSTVEEGELDRILELAQQAVVEARRVIADLRPTILDDFGLGAAIRQLVSSLRTEPRAVEYAETLGEERLPAAAETALYRVAQEALTNARKHAGEGAAVRVSLGREGSKARLEVRDFGRGFVPEREAGGGGPGERIGLSSMRERVALLGGGLTIEGRPGEGTSVVAEVPLSAGAGPEVAGGA